MSVMEGTNSVFVNCTIIAKNKFSCNGTVYVPEEEPLNYEDTWFWIYLGIYVALVLVAGLVSGLTMGLLSLDIMSLNVLASGGKPNEKKYARKIIPLVKRHHLLLVTLLLTNAAAVESMPLFLDRISDPVIAIVVSVTAVLIFGEVVPQAICTRYGLAIGAAMSPVVKLLILITLPVSWPLSKLLDCVLGHDHATFFRRAELSVLVDLHQQQDSENEEPLSQDEVLVIKGALLMREKKAKQAYTPLDRLYALDINGHMDETTMEEIMESGHSRIPIYEGDRSNLLGVLLVKRLIKLDPDDRISIRRVFETEKRDLPKVSENVQLFDLLNEFQLGKSHMCCVTRDPGESNDGSSPVIGIITLEDVIEELIQEEILDETDEIDVDVARRLQIAKSRVARRSYTSVSRDPSRSFTAIEEPRSSREFGSDPGLADSDTKPLLEP